MDFAMGNPLRGRITGFSVRKSNQKGMTGEGLISKRENKYSCN